MTTSLRPGLYIVLHINSFSDQLENGYLARREEYAAASEMPISLAECEARELYRLVKIGNWLSRSEVLGVLLANPGIQVRVLRV